MTPNSKNTPPPSRLKARILRSGCGCTISTEQAEAHQAAPHSPYSVARAHRRASRSGGPATSRPGRGDRERQRDLDHDDQWLGVARRVGQKGARHGKPGEPDHEEHRRPGDQNEPQPPSADRGRRPQPGDHHQQPHRGQDRGALEGSAGCLRPDPEDVNADHDPDRRQQPGEEGQHAVPAAFCPQPRCAAPEPVRRQRPHADQGEQQHDFLEQCVERAVGHQHGGDRIADAGRRRGAPQPPVRGSAPARAATARVRQDRQTPARHSAPAATRSDRPGRSAAVRAPVGRRRADAAMSRAAGHAAADRRLGQRHIDGGEADPDEGQQQTVGDEADDGGEGWRARRRSTRPRRAPARARPASRANADGHACWPAAPNRPGDQLGDGRAGQQDQQPDGDELQRGRAARPPAAEGPARSARDRGCRPWSARAGAYSASGKRSSPTVPARKKNAPAETATTVAISSSVCIVSAVRRAAPGGIRTRHAVDESDGGEGRQQRQCQGDIHGGRRRRSPRPAAAVPRCRRCRAAAPPSCGRRRPARAGRAPAPAPPSPARTAAAASRNSAIARSACMNTASSAASCAATGSSDIEAVDQQRPVLVRTRRQRARHQACQRAERVTRCARWQARGGYDHEARAAAASGIERAPRDVHACDTDWPGKRRASRSSASWPTAASGPAAAGAGSPRSPQPRRPPLRRQIAGVGRRQAPARGRGIPPRARRRRHWRPAAGVSRHLACAMTSSTRPGGS